MRKLVGALIVLGLFATPAIAQRITIDYDHDYEFEQVKTFTYVETADTNVRDGLMDGRIRDAIIQQLVNGGVGQVDSGGDLNVTYHMTSREQVVLNTSTHGYGGWGRGWGRWGGGVSMASSTTTASTYTEGTLIVDAYDPHDKELVWRGTGTVTVKAKPEKRTKQVQKIVTKMGKRWQKILAKQGK